MPKEIKGLRKFAKKTEELSRQIERTAILNRILRYLIKTRQTTLNYEEIEEIVKSNQPL